MGPAQAVTIIMASMTALVVKDILCWVEWMFYCKDVDREGTLQKLINAGAAVRSAYLGRFFDGRCNYIDNRDSVHSIEV